MGKVGTGFSTSLDGFIAGPNGRRGGANVAHQAIEAGLADEIGIDLVPVLLMGASGSSTTAATGRPNWNPRK
ncbi:MAG: hypothetical protein AVDCRST_MAG02-1590 [uncultured Rubrobacteraceae bacterium]|uniref:Uncharacterized protein n=1 Tax=uncultured Rubrobacteraceae bacterium TaxID=349277 RepID=A0A6J4QV01_9ACTN|nr:MAG: hypothetical protein AVDCRST_MAG02-1590 [uncultured Rubrobacteraceae bacterium]